MNKKLFFILCLALLLQASLVLNVKSIPMIPETFYGKVTINGQLAPDGTIVKAEIPGIISTNTTTSNGNYTLMVLADDPDTSQIEGGRAGDIVYFYVNDKLVAKYPFESGGVINLNLKIGAQIAVKVGDSIQYSANIIQHPELQGLQTVTVSITDISGSVVTEHITYTFSNGTTKDETRTVDVASNADFVTEANMDVGDSKTLQQFNVISIVSQVTKKEYNGQTKDVCLFNYTDEYSAKRITAYYDKNTGFLLELHVAYYIYFYSLIVNSTVPQPSPSPSPSPSPVPLPQPVISIIDAINTLLRTFTQPIGALLNSIIGQNTLIDYLFVQQPIVLLAIIIIVILVLYEVVK